MRNNAGSEQLRLDDVEVTSGASNATVQFISSSATVAEGDGSTNLTAEISNPDGNEVDVDVALDEGSSADASDIGNYSTQTITFPSDASDGDTETVSVTITDDSEVEGTETATFNLTNLSTSGDASIGSPSQFDLDITDNDLSLSIPFSEPFDGSNLFTVEQGALGFNGTDDYFAVDDGSNINKSYSGVNGSFLAGQDTDADGISGGAAPVEIEWTGIDISGESGLAFTGSFAEVDDGGDIDDDDFIRVEYRVDGGSWQNLIAFENDGSSFNTDFLEDTDFDGVGDGTKITSPNGTLVEFTKDIFDTGSSLDLRLRAHVDSGDEDFAAEDFSLTPVVVVNDDDGGEAFAPCDVSPDANNISNGLSQGGASASVRVCPGTYSETTLDIQKDVTLESGADVTISDELTLSSGTFDVESGSLTLESTSETSIAAIAGTGSGSVAGDVTFERVLTKSDDASHFRFLSAPTATALDDEGGGSNAGNLLSNMWTQSDGTDTGADAEGSSVDPSVFTYDEGFDIGNNEDLSDGWASVTELNSGTGDFSPGTGFLAFLFADRDPNDGTTEGFPATLTATGSVQPEENDGNAVDLSSQITFTDNDSQSDDGWNLIANPFMAPIDWESIENDGNDLDAMEATIYVWDAGNGAYATYTADSGPGGTGTQDQFIAPFQAFFVKATGSGSGGNGPDIGGIDSGDKDTGQSPEFKSNETSTPQIALQLRAEGDSTGETTAFRYAEDASAGKDAYDAFQLEPLTTSRTLVASEMSGTDALFDHQNRPVPAEQDSINLALDITEGGTYTLEASALENLPGDWKVILENTDSGARWDLGAGQSATFSVEAPESKSTTEATSPAELLRDGPTVAKASTDSELPSYRLFVGPQAALPVELAGFNATVTDAAVHLMWRTASETNNAGFHVEHRGPEAEGFASNGFVEGHGTTDQPQEYRYRSDPLGPGRHVFRLRQVDLDGAATRSDTVAVRVRLAEAATMQVAPNPVRSRATASLRVRTEQEVHVALYDVLGRRVRTLHDGPMAPGRAHTLQMNASGLSSGLYLLRADGEQFRKTSRVTVVR